MPARMVPASMAGQLAQLGVGDCLRFAVGDEHPDEGHAVGAKFQVYGAPFRQKCLLYGHKKCTVQMHRAENRHEKTTVRVHRG